MLHYSQVNFLKKMTELDDLTEVEHKLASVAAEVLDCGSFRCVVLNGIMIFAFVHTYSTYYVLIHMYMYIRTYVCMSHKAGRGPGTHCLRCATYFVLSVKIILHLPSPHGMVCGVLY